MGSAREQIGVGRWGWGARVRALESAATLRTSRFESGGWCNCKVYTTEHRRGPGRALGKGVKSKENRRATAYTRVCALGRHEEQHNVVASADTGLPPTEATDLKRGCLSVGMNKQHRK